MKKYEQVILYRLTNNRCINFKKYKKNNLINTIKWNDELFQHNENFKHNIKRYLKTLSYKDIKYLFNYISDYDTLYNQIIKNKPQTLSMYIAKTYLKKICVSQLEDDIIYPKWIYDKGIEKNELLNYSITNDTIKISRTEIKRIINSSYTNKPLILVKDSNNKYYSLSAYGFLGNAYAWLEMQNYNDIPTDTIKKYKDTTYNFLKSFGLKFVCVLVQTVKNVFLEQGKEQTDLEYNIALKQLMFEEAISSVHYLQQGYSTEEYIFKMYSDK